MAGKKGGRKAAAADDDSEEAGMFNTSYAARTLAEWVKKMSGAELPIVEKAPANTPVIYIGKAAIEAGLKLDDLKSISNEGIKVVCDGKSILIAGQNGRSTVKAVCRLLEELGCRYLNDIGELARGLSQHPDRHREGWPEAGRGAGHDGPQGVGLGLAGQRPVGRVERRRRHPAVDPTRLGQLRPGVAVRHTSGVLRADSTASAARATGTARATSSCARSSPTT